MVLPIRDQDVALGVDRHRAVRAVLGRTLFVVVATGRHFDIARSLVFGRIAIV